MPTTYVNYWKEIAEKFESKFREEFKGSMPIFVGDGDHSGNQFLKIIPQSNSLSERYVFGELREYSFKFIYYFMDANIKKKALIHMLRMISRIESLIASNRKISLDDSTEIVNNIITDYEIIEGSEGYDYLIDINFNCQHLGNLG